MTTFSAFGENSKPICHGSPRPLLELASIKTAFNIWLRKFNEFYPAGNNEYINIAEFNFHYEESISVPSQIKKIIDSELYPTARELHNWVRYINCGVKNFSYDQIYSRFDLVVFGGNGTVHFKDTIANFLEDDTLSLITRFEMACVNCVEEKIDFFWPLVSNELNVDDLQFNNNFLLYYWICRKRCELYRIPLEEFSSIERLMFEKCHQKSIYLAIEYFFTLLNTNDRLVEFHKLLILDEDITDFDDDEGILDTSVLFDYKGYETFTCLFPNVDGPMQNLILNRYTARILYTLVTCLKPIEYSVQCFLYIKDIITPHCYYREVILKLLQYIYLYSDRRRENEISEKEEGFWYQQMDTALEQIWLHTPLQSKEYVLENLSTVLNVYKEYDTHCLQNFGRDIRFLFALLSDINVQLRNTVWNENWRWWIEGVPPPQFKALMRLCLVETEEIEKFKDYFWHTEQLQYYSERLLCKGYFTEFDEFLSSLYPNHDLLLSIKKRILCNETEIFDETRETIEKYATYIDNLFSNNVLAADFKNEMFCSYRILEVLLQKELLTRNDLNMFGNNLCDVRFILSLFVSPQKHTEIKENFLEMLQDKIYSGRLYPFSGNRWNEFLMWCMDNDEQRIDEFLASFHVNSVFPAVFLDCLPYEGRHSRVFETLVDFLVWYFESQSAAQNYIRERVEFYESLDAALFERIFQGDKQTIIDVMKNQLLRNDEGSI